MAIEKVFAHVSCSDLERSKAWYSILFGRKPDAEPMQHLAEWHHGQCAGMQLFGDTSKAGKSTVTLMVTGLRDEYQRLAAGDLHPGDVESGDQVSLVRLRDPDDNVVVLAQPGRA
jgi:hypothetical protein